MRQVNFTLIFVICLALVLFGLENTQTVSIKLIEGTVIRTPLCIALVCSLGIGALLAWVFSVWVTFQATLVTQNAVQAKDVQIETLQTHLEQYKAELEEQQHLLPSSSSSASESNQS